jgi:hypothetical protein
LLEGYCTLNYEAIRKILKKYDKTFGTNKSPQYIPLVENKSFFAHSGLRLLITETEVTIPPLFFSFYSVLTKEILTLFFFLFQKKACVLSCLYRWTQDSSDGEIEVCGKDPFCVMAFV